MTKPKYTAEQRLIMSMQKQLSTVSAGLSELLKLAGQLSAVRKTAPSQTTTRPATAQGQVLDFSFALPDSILEIVQKVADRAARRGPGGLSRSPNLPVERSVEPAGFMLTRSAELATALKRVKPAPQRIQTSDVSLTPRAQLTLLQGKLEKARRNHKPRGKIQKEIAKLEKALGIR